MSIERIIIVGFDDHFSEIKDSISQVEDAPTLIDVSRDGTRCVKIYTRLAHHKQQPFLVVIHDNLVKIKGDSILKLIRSLEFGMACKPAPILYFTDRSSDELSDMFNQLGHIFYLRKKTAELAEEEISLVSETIEKLIVKLRGSSE